MFEAADGPLPTRFDVDAVESLRLGQDGPRRVVGATKVGGVGWVTDQRIVVACKNYAQVRWDRDRTVTELAFYSGVTWAVGDFLFDKAAAKLKSAGKSMVGHLHYPWLRSVNVVPGDRKTPTTVRFAVSTKVAGGQTLTWLLGLTPGRGINPDRLADLVVRRAVQWWLTNGGLLSAEQRAALEATPGNPGRNNSGGARYELPVYRWAHPHTIETPASPPAPPAAAPAAAKALTTVPDRSVLMAHADRYQPAFCWLDDRENAVSELGFSCVPGRGLVPEASETLVGFYAVKARATIRFDPYTGAPPTANYLVQPLFRGRGVLMVTNQRLVYLQERGYTALGMVDQDGPAFAVVLLHNDVYWVATEINDQVPALAEVPVLVFANDFNSYSRLIIEEISEVRDVDGNWQPYADDLRDAAHQFATRIRACIGLAGEPGEEPRGPRTWTYTIR